MPRSTIIRRLGPVVVAAGAAFAVLGVAPVTVAAGGPPAVPLIDGWRPGPAPVTATVTVEAYVLRVASPRAKARGKVRAQALASVAAEPAGGDPCFDKAWGPKDPDKIYRWIAPYAWSFQAASTPTNIGRRATERILRRSAANITAARNDCGRADRNRASAIYQGRTDRRPGVTAAGGCADMDRVNVVGFGRLPSGIAGLTCIWSSDGRILEADIKLDRRARWALTLANCTFESMVEAVATHEFGHAFGLGHVREATHGRLTMSEQLDGYCQLNEATLGLGDMLGLEARY